MSESLPNWGSARPMSEASRDGREILLQDGRSGSFLVGFWVDPDGWCVHIRNGAYADWGPESDKFYGWWLLPEQSR